MSPSTEDPKFKPIAVPIDAGCGILGVKRSKFYQLGRNGEIEIISIGGRSLAVVASLEACVERAREAAAAKRKAA